MVFLLCLPWELLCKAAGERKSVKKKRERENNEKIKVEEINTLVLLILQEEAHHLLPEPSMVPSPWKLTPESFEKCSQVLGFLGSQSSGSVGAIIVPLICNQGGR